MTGISGINKNRIVFYQLVLSTTLCGYNKGSFVFASHIHINTLCLFTFINSFVLTQPFPKILSHILVLGFNIHGMFCIIVKPGVGKEVPPLVKVVDFFSETSIENKLLHQNCADINFSQLGMSS